MTRVPPIWAKDLLFSCPRCPDPIWVEWHVDVMSWSVHHLDKSTAVNTDAVYEDPDVALRTSMAELVALVRPGDETEPGVDQFKDID
jgi:hypothetical protein